MGKARPMLGVTMQVFHVLYVEGIGRIWQPAFAMHKVVGLRFMAASLWHHASPHHPNIDTTVDEMKEATTLDSFTDKHANKGVSED